MATMKEIKELALHAARGTAPATYEVGTVNQALLDQMRGIAGSINQFMKNRYDIYEIITQTADEILPAKVIDALGIFAEVQVVEQGKKALFKNPTLGKNRAKKFLTQVGLSGLYETFRLDKSTFELTSHAVGGAVSLDFERFLDGAETMAELMDIVLVGLTDAVYLEVQKALKAALTNSARPAANVVIANNFDGAKMFSLCATVKAYGGSGTGAGGGAVIFAPPEFVAAMGPDAIVPVTASVAGVYHPQDIDAIHNQGYINLFRGTPVVQIPQSFVDENNDTTWIDPQLAYVLPTGGERVVKIMFEGTTQVNDFKNRDNSMEIHVYKKMGSAILTHHNWGIYQNTRITDTSYNPYPNL